MGVLPPPSPLMVYTNVNVALYSCEVVLYGIFCYQFPRDHNINKLTAAFIMLWETVSIISTCALTYSFFVLNTIPVWGFVLESLSLLCVFCAVRAWLTHRYWILSKSRTGTIILSLFNGISVALGIIGSGLFLGSSKKGFVAADIITDLSIDLAAVSDFIVAIALCYELTKAGGKTPRTGAKSVFRQMAVTSILSGLFLAFMTTVVVVFGHQRNPALANYASVCAHVYALTFFLNIFSRSMTKINPGDLSTTEDVASRSQRLVLTRGGHQQQTRFTSFTIPSFARSAPSSASSSPSSSIPPPTDQKILPEVLVSVPKDETSMRRRRHSEPGSPVVLMCYNPNQAA